MTRLAVVAGTEDRRPCDASDSDSDFVTFDFGGESIVSAVESESAMDAIADDADVVAAMAAAGGLEVAGVVATAGGSGVDGGKLIGVGFGLSSSDASNASPSPNEATTRKP